MAAVLLVALHSLAGGSLLAQGSRSASVIVRLVPGVNPKAAIAEIAAATGGLSTRPRMLFDNGGGRAVLSAGRAASGLDRYMVVESGSASGAQLIAAVRTSSLVEDAFPNHRYHINGSPNDSLFAQQWALARVEAEGAWAGTVGDSSVLIGVLDTGIDFLHPDLIRALAVNRMEDINGNGRFDPWSADEIRDGVRGDLDGIDEDGNGFADDVIGYDFVDQTLRNVGDWTNRDAVPGDELGHGTNVAGVIAATANNRVGIAGLAPGCRLLALRAFDAGGNGEDDDIAAAVVYAADRGARVINLSFGDYYASPLLHDAIRYAYLRGVTVVASSGNEGGSDPHYPSAFAEVIGVGATDSSDFLAPFTTYGTQLSLSAPGSGVYTTALEGAYKVVSGTSFSAPYVSAAAGLLLSLHPNWSPDEVRSVLELSADDRGRGGWDLNYGAGRLNARRAVEFPGAAAVAVESPAADSGAKGSGTVEVIGSAYSPILESWQLFMGVGDDPRDWTPLGDVQRTGRVRAVLGSFRPADFGSGAHTLRLLVKQTNGRQTERRVRLALNAAQPAIVSSAVHNVWRFNERAVAVTVRTDQPTAMTVYVRRADRPGDAYLPVALEAERTGFVRDHYVLLGRDELERALEYHCYVVLRDASGDTAMIGSKTAPLAVIRERDAFSTTTMFARPYALPFGYVLAEPRVLYGDGAPCIALNRFEGGGYGPLEIHSLTGGRFARRDSTSAGWIPRGIGDTDGDGLFELLGQLSGRGVIYSQTDRGGSVLARTVYQDTASNDFWGAALRDLDGDGRDEVIARTDNAKSDPSVYYIADRVVDSLVRIAMLPNASDPASGDSRNKFGPPAAQFADFDGDGRLDLLIGDDDADFMIYRRAANGAYERMWIDQNDGEGGTEYTAAGDVNGDGRPEAIVAYHSRTGQSFTREYAVPFWTVKIFSFGPDGTATMIWRDSVAYVRPTLPALLFGSVAAGDLDGRPGDEVAVAFFPGLYVFTWDSVRATMVPLWYREGVNSNKPIISDMDGDGVAEIGVGDIGVAGSERIRFFQINSTYRGPRAPAGFQGWAENDSTVYLSWNPTPNTEFYTLYRGVRNETTGTIRFDSVARTSAVVLRDTGFVAASGARLDRGGLYFYVVTARNTALDVNDSLLSNAVLVLLHNPARIASAKAADPGSIRIEMDARLKNALYRPGSFEIRNRAGDPVEIATVVYADPQGLLVTLRTPAPDDSLVLRPTAMLRDFFDTPADTTAAFGLSMPRRELPGERFIATRALLVSRDTIAVEFNADVDSVDARRLAGYAIAPGGTFIAALRDDATPTRVLLVLRGDYPIGAFGRTYTITITGLRSADGRLINDGAGSTVGLALTAPNLDEVGVYPHPFSRKRDGRVTFSGLTRSAQVRILTISGRVVRVLEEREGDGGVMWDGTDDAGFEVPSGVYLYMVEGTAANGENYRSEPHKIAVVP